MIIVPRKRNLILPSQEIEVPALMKAEYAGEWELKVLRSDGSERTRMRFPNMILNSGLDALMGAYSNIGNAIVVGSGNTAPVATQTQLQTLVATQAGGSSPWFSGSNQASAPYYGQSTVTKTFGIGAAAGNLTEIGLCCGANQTSQPLFSRALIVDGGGNPTTLTVLSDEQLIATHYCRQYVPTSDVTGTVTISGTPYDYTIRAAECTSSYSGFKQVLDGPGNVAHIGGDVGACYATQTLAAITGVPSGTSATYVSSQFTFSAYTVGNYYRDGTFAASITQNNVAGGIGSMVLNTSRGSYQVSFNPVIPKDGTKTLSLTFRFGVARR